MDTFNIIREAHKGFGYLILVAALVFIVALLMAMFIILVKSASY